MILVDTGFLLAMFNKRDGLHARARAWAKRIREPLLVTEYVLVEAADGLSDYRTRRFGVIMMEFVRTQPLITLLPASTMLRAAGVALYEKTTDKSWSLTDCISFAIMREHGLYQALAHDEHFTQAGFDALLLRDPDI